MFLSNSTIINNTVYSTFYLFFYSTTEIKLMQSIRLLAHLTSKMATGYRSTQQQYKKDQMPNVTTELSRHPFPLEQHLQNVRGLK